MSALIDLSKYPEYRDCAVKFTDIFPPENERSDYTAQELSEEYHRRGMHISQEAHKLQAELDAWLDRIVHPKQVSE